MFLHLDGRQPLAAGEPDVPTRLNGRDARPSTLFTPAQQEPERYPRR